MTATDNASPGRRLLKLWGRLNSLPFGPFLFSKTIAMTAPYSGSINPRVDVLEVGYCRAKINDRRRFRNHLNSIHALALANLGELVSGLAMLVSLPENVRGIVVSITTQYVKKARGQLTAESKVSVPNITQDTEFTVVAVIRDSTNDVVAEVAVEWNLRLKSG